MAHHAFSFTRQLLVAALVASHVQSGLAFMSLLISPVLQGLAHRSFQPLCLFGRPSALQSEPSKTERLIPVTSAKDPKPYGQRLYPVHPDDMSVADRRTGLFKMILAVGVRDVTMGMMMALVLFAVGAGFNSPNYHFPYAIWLFSCIFGRLVTQDEFAPNGFNLQHAATASTKHLKVPSIQKSASFAQWRSTAITSPRPRVNSGTQRMVVNFAPSEPAVEQASSSSSNAAGLMHTIVVGFVSDVAGALRWVFDPKSNVPADEEPGVVDVWDPRDLDTPIDSRQGV